LALRSFVFVHFESYLNVAISGNWAMLIPRWSEFTGARGVPVKMARVLKLSTLVNWLDCKSSWEHRWKFEN